MDNAVVMTTKGALEGFIENGVRKFYGVPVAEPPVGKLRLMAGNKVPLHIDLACLVFTILMNTIDLFVRIDFWF